MYKNFTSLGLFHQQLPKLLRIMRLTAIILMISFVHLSAATLAQKISISEKNASLEKVLKEIRKQSGYDIIYDLNLVVNTKPVSINVEKANVFEVLQKTLATQQLTFTVDGKTIVIKERGMIDKITDMVVDHEVKVQVRDSLNLPIPGANVYNKTINKMYVTDKNGEIIIKDVPANGYVLMISYVGFQGQEIFVDRKTTTYWVALKQATSALEEINIVSNGYQKISKERAAGAYSVVTAKEIQETPAVNLMERLEGKVAGVKFDIKNNTIQIRGVTNYAGAAGSPLIVLDGFPLMDPSDRPTLTKAVSGNAWGNSVISNINIADIEQITFLKDASATSIWGSRAANGVIVIETKKGKKVAQTLNMSYNFGISKNPSISNLKWMNSAQYIDLEQELVNKNLLADPTNAQPGNEIYTTNNSEASEWMFKVKRGTATPAQRDAALAEIGTRNSMAQVEDKLLQNAVNHQYNLSYNGGSASSSYYISGGYTKDIPVYKSNFGENMFFNANTSTELFNKRITLRALFNYQYSKSQYNAAATNALAVSTTALRPYDLIEDANGNSIARNIILRDSKAGSMVAQGYLPFTYNTLDELNYSNSFAKNNIFRMNAGINGKIANWLNADVSISNQRQIGSSYSLDEVESYAGRILVNTYTTIANNKPFYNLPYGGKYTTYGNNAMETAIRGQLNSEFKLGKDHHFNAIAGTEIRETESSNTSEIRYGYNSDTRTIAQVNPTVQLPTMYGYTQSIGTTQSSLGAGRKRFLSYYGNASYSYQEKYFLTGSARFDDYTLLGLDRSKRAKPFWSVGMRWNASKETFIQQFEWLNSLSLRATIGTSGVVPQGGSNITIINIGTDDRVGQPTANIETPANSDLGWETTKMANLGIDFGLLKGRLSGSFDVYNKRSTGILVQFPFNATYGWSSLLFNSGKLRGNGYEFSLNADLVRAGKFNWKSILNFGYTNNLVTESRLTNNAANLAGSASTIDGEALGTLFLYRWAGLDNKGQSQIYDRNNNIINNTTNLNTTTFTKEDLVKVGRLYAPYSGGFNHSFRYGNLELGVQITGYFGHVFLKNSVTNANYPSSDQFAYQGVLGRQEDLAYRWKKPGDEAITNVPGITGVNFNSVNRYRFSDALVRKADNIRLQQISLAYSVPQRLLPRNIVKNLSIAANVRNLGILWRANKDGIDPEYINTGNYSSITPTPSYVFGINATF